MIIALTTLMFITLLVWLPLQVKAAFCLNLSEKHLLVQVNVFFVPFFKEKFTLDGLRINCQGSVDTEINLPDVDPKGGKFYMQAIVVDSVNLTFAVNYLEHSPNLMVALESLVFGATTLACLLTHCRIHTSTQFSKQTAVFGEVRLSVTLADVFIALVRSAFYKRRAGAQA